MKINPMQSNWQSSLTNAITDPKILLEKLDLDLALLPAAQRAAKLFPLRVPQSFVAKIQKGNPTDPLLQQILPLAVELDEVEGFDIDPLQEKKSNPIPGLLHKYHGRVLLTVTGVCGINCRFCFRREFPYVENNPGSFGWEEVISYIKADTSIQEVIFSGGDPLMANDTILEKLTQKISAIPHVRTLRIHTRMPLVIPERITPELIAWFTGSRLKPVMVIHCNHPQEIDNQVITTLQHLSSKGVILLNQAVLLKGVNDTSEVLCQLSARLFEAGILPYYLHLLDKVRGTAHFEVEEGRARQLINEMTYSLPGYLVPKLVREEPGAKSKVML